MNSIATILTALVFTVSTEPAQEIPTTTIIVTDNAAQDGDATPLRATAMGDSRDDARAQAYRNALETCGGTIRQLGFDSHDDDAGPWAELWYRCAAPELVL